MLLRNANLSESRFSTKELIVLGILWYVESRIEEHAALSNSFEGRRAFKRETESDEDTRLGQ